MDIKTIQDKAAQGDPVAQNQLGAAYMTGQHIGQDKEAGVYWFHQAASKGFPLAIGNLGKCLLAGDGIRQDIPGALFALESAYLMGLEDALGHILSAIESGILDFSALLAASESSTEAQLVLGLCYDHGVRVNADHHRALELFMDAANQGDPTALWLLGRMLATAETPDLVQAEMYLKNALAIAQKRVGSVMHPHMENDYKNTLVQLRRGSPFILAKFITECTDDGKPADQYVQSFLNGQLFMKTLDQFGDMTKRAASAQNNFRGDILEGYSESFGTGYNPYMYASDEHGIIKDGIIGHIDVLALRKKVFCMTAIDYDPVRGGFLPPSEEMRAFGNYVVVVTDPEEFVRRVHTAFERYCSQSDVPYTLDYDRISYDVELFGQIKFNEFHKSFSYAQQNEFRISIDFTGGRFSPEILKNVTDFAKATFSESIQIDSDPLSLSDILFFDIGDIRDICQVMTTAEFFSPNPPVFSMNVEPVQITPYHPLRDPRPTFCKAVALVQLQDGSIHVGTSEKAIYSAIM